MPQKRGPRRNDDIKKETMLDFNAIDEYPPFIVLVLTKNYYAKMKERENVQTV